MEIILLLFVFLGVYYLCITGKIYTILFSLFFKCNTEKIKEFYFFGDTITSGINVMPRYKNLKVGISSRLELNEYSGRSGGSSIAKNLYTQKNNISQELLYLGETHNFYTQVHVPKLQDLNIKLQEILKKKLKVHNILGFKESLSGLNIGWSYKIYIVLGNGWNIPYSKTYIQIFETIEQERDLKSTTPNITPTRYIGLTFIALIIFTVCMYFGFLYLNDF